MPVLFEPETKVEPTSQIAFEPDGQPDEHPPVKLPDGSIATVRSIGVGDEHGEWVIPTIVAGKPVSNDEAIRLWRSGQNKPLAGPFKTIEEADQFGQQFHESEAKRLGLGAGGGVQFEPEGFLGPDTQGIIERSKLALQGPGRPLMGLGASRAITPSLNPDLDELRDQLRGTGIKYAADVINAGIPWAIKGVSNLLPGINNAVEEVGATVLNSPETLRYWLMKAIKPITGVEPEYNPPFKPGESIFPTPKEPFLGTPSNDTFLGSMVNDLAEQIRGMATPGVIVSAGGAGLEGQLAKEGTGLAGRLIAGYYGGEIGASLPDAATQAFDILGDPKATPAEKGAAIARVGGPVALGALLLHGAAKNAAEKPAGSLPSGELKPTEAPNAEAIRSGEGQLPSGGIIPEGIQETGGNVVEQKPPQQPKPVETGIQFEPEQAGEAKPSEVMWSSSFPQSGKEMYLSDKKFDSDNFSQGRESKQYEVSSKNPFDADNSSDSEMLDLYDKLGGLEEAPQNPQFIKALKAKGYDSIIGRQTGYNGESKWMIVLDPSKQLKEYKIPKPPTEQAEVTPISRGPGAAAEGEPGSYSPIQRMADELRATADENEPIDSQISNIEKAKAAVGAAKDYVANSLSGLKAMADAVWNKWTGLPEYGDEQRAVGKWNYAIQKADHEARQFAREVVKAVPDKVRREAITNWIQADGDMGVLQSRSAASKGRIKQGYEIAQRLTEREKQIAQMLREYYDQQLERGIASGILKEGLPNYITQVWKKENPITKRLISELSMGKLQPNFRYARKRIFDSYFEGEQAGYKPNKDAGFLVANYDQTFNRSLAARAFIKDLHEGVASDGRPLVEISGNGKLIGEEEGNQSVLIKPKAKGEDLHDYRTIDHPALRGWKWATKTPEGQNIFVQGDMLVHPEAYQKLKNRLSISAFRQNPYIRAALNFQTNIKQTMLSVSGFHQVQETLHALGHRVNPMGLPEIDFTDPITKAGVEHGLQLADYNALQSFSEGLTGGGLLTKIPYAGKYLHAYNEWLFQDYIPRLKLQLYKSALERNRNLYPKLPEDKLMGLTAGEANSAFGELPYRYWGRNPTLQDAFRTFLLAPDFLEARGRFVGRAVKPYGREQLMALGYLAAAQYVVTRILNQTLDGDPHWEPKNMFRVVAGNHAYGLRTIPGDLLHLFSDTRGFLYNRMSPMLRTAVTFITGRDSRGIKRDISEQAKDLATMPIPISLKPRNGQTFWEGFMNSFGVQTSRWDATQTINERVKQFKQSNNITDPYETVYNPENDKFAGLRNAIERGNHDAAMTELVKLRKDVPDGKIWQHFKLSMTKPLTGSRANDDKFKQSLGTVGLQELKEAQDLRLSRLKMIQQLMSEKPK